MSLLLQASWTWGPEGQGAILLVNCDRDTPWLPKEDCSDEKVYSKQGASGATLGDGGNMCVLSRAGQRSRQEIMIQMFSAQKA